MRSRHEAGFALIAALWALLLVGAIGAAYLAGAHEVVLVSGNRSAELAARQAALAGLERAHNVLERLHVLSLDDAAALDLESRARLTAIWNHLDTAFEQVESECLGRACFDLRARDLGAALNVNLASESRLRRLFLALGADYRDVDVAAQSIADWIDADDLHRGRGAEREYYVALRFPYEPRNGPIADLSELRRVRGLQGPLYELAVRYLTVEGDGRINLNAAPAPVLSTLPGIGAEAVRVILEARRRGLFLSNPFELNLRLSAAARARLQDSLSELMQLAVFEPRQVEVISTGRYSEDGVWVAFRAVYVRAGDRVVQVKRTRFDP
jgi:general secretion pathway protein K